MKMDISLIAAQNVYDILLQRYKELRRGSSSSENGDEAYDINPYLMSLSTEKIDADYMDSRFKKYVKMLNEHADERPIESVLNELHRSFASLTQDEQKYANILLKDIQNNDFIVREDSNVMDYIVVDLRIICPQKTQFFAKVNHLINIKGVIQCENYVSHWIAPLIILNITIK